MFSVAFDHFIIHLLYGLGVFCISAFLNHYMLKVKIEAVPEARSNHTSAVPKTGGIGISVAFYIGLMGFFFLSQHDDLPSGQFTIFMLTSTLIVLFFMYDDFRNLPAWLKFCVQTIAAILIVLSGIYIKKITLPSLGTLHLDFWGVLLSVFWIIFFMNVYNFMDGINGVAGGGALIGLFFLCFFSLVYDVHFVYIGALILFFATLGFFIFNFPRGRLFLGDSGSQIIGFVIAVLTLLLTKKTQTELSVLIVPMIFFTFIYDVCLTLIMRLKHGLNIFIPHRSFLFHILHRCGWSHTQVAMVQYTMLLFDSLCVCFMLFSPDTLKLFFMLPIVLKSMLYTFFVYTLSKRKKISCYF